MCVRLCVVGVVWMCVRSVCDFQCGVAWFVCCVVVYVGVCLLVWFVLRVCVVCDLLCVVVWLVVLRVSCCVGACVFPMCPCVLSAVWFAVVLLFVCWRVWCGMVCWMCVFCLCVLV